MGQQRERSLASASGLKHVGEHRPVQAWLAEFAGDGSAVDASSQAPEVEMLTYHHEMEAYIDLSKRAHGRAEDVFGWDDIVVDRYTGLSCHEKKLLGCKVTPRD